MSHPRAARVPDRPLPRVTQLCWPLASAHPFIVTRIGSNLIKSRTISGVVASRAEAGWPVIEYGDDRIAWSYGAICPSITEAQFCSYDWGADRQMVALQRHLRNRPRHL
jgi:hypothetical protein